MFSPLRVGRQFWRAMTQHRWFWLGAVICVVIAQTTIIASGFLFKYLIDDAVRLANQTPRETTALVERIWQLALLWTVGWFAWRGSGMLAAQAQTRTERDLLLQGFRAVLERSFRFFESSFVGALSRKIRRYGDAFSTMAEQIMWTL